MAMAMAGPVTENRALARNEVHYRMRAFGPDAQQVSLLIVNLSARGLMARADVPYQVGERMRINLPVVVVVVAEIRWSLGGRIGCELDQPIGLPDYYDLLAVLLKAQQAVAPIDQSTSSASEAGSWIGQPLNRPR